MSRTHLFRAAAAVAVLAAAIPAPSQAQSLAAGAPRTAAVMHRTVKIDGMDIFYREAGPRDAPTILLLHGFPTSSHMFRNLIPALMDRYHVVAPDFPGYGQSSMPSRDSFAYTFANLTSVTDKFTQAIGLDRYTLYLMDYGAPVGYRLALAHPERVQALIVQNGNAYDEGLREFWDVFRTYWGDATPGNRNAMRKLLTSDATRWQYLHGVRDSARVSPDTWTVDQRQLDRPGNDEVQLDLFYDYRTNLPLYPRFQAYFREHQPPTLIVWGKDDPIFPWQGAEPYKRDLKTLEYHLLDTGHFALEERGDEIAAHIRAFMGRHVRAGGRTAAAPRN
ncbi:MAG: Hydrolase, alpha/beta fold family [uncultured Gemmatimonadetes bacterium]|uniref:Hydrolase, alpha/beta fold family n=1 Tax=uncultured Gemmatimonadota bacterium TaxID=203437 RepID=A0A6J4KYI2_9BACT|nr:MAG: Hydrolase, alpha/beta fold family [uncultured Gemmatimonadota bacterium]